MEPARCPTEDDVAGYVAGELAAGSHRELSAHLDSCDRCRRLVSALAGSEPTLRGGDVEPSPVAEPGATVGKFALVRRLGHGAMGEVWAARDPELDREVALKLIRLRPGAFGGEETLRLRREAQAMARLVHPNVVRIYELGTAADDRVFCAMELVDGVTLRAHLARRRPWREVVRIALDVGRGLAAAHAAGLVHRDVKPENILIATDGRTLVSDFGLARLGDLEDVPGGELAFADPALTAAGAVIGTPLYMAPEQLAGKVADPRSDQFAFCVTIYEALFGARPFDGETLGDLARSIERGPVRQAPRGVPAGVIRALHRGLAADPDARWPAMAPLVAELERAARAPRRRRIGLAIAAGVAAIGAAGLVVVQQHTANNAPDAQITRAWNPEKAAALQVAFASTGSPLAGERAATVTRAFDVYRADWLAQRAAVHTNDDLAARQLACFDRLAQLFDRVIALCLAPARRDVEQAPAIAYRLESVESCSAERVAARSIAPSTWAGKLAALDLDTLELLQLQGRHAEALRTATALVATAERGGEPMVLARARYDLGSAQANAGHNADAEATLRTAIQDAAAARDHYLVAAAWLRLYDVVGLELARPADAAAMEPAVRAAVAQAGDDPNQLADLEMELGLVAYGHGDVASARDHFAAARERRIAARGPDHPNVGNDETNLGGALLQLGQLDDATAHLERGAAIIRARFGDHHPVIAHVEQSLAAIAARRKDWPGSEAHARAALAVDLAVLAPDSPEIAKIRKSLARALREQHRYDDARAQLELARASLARSLPPTHPERIMIDLELAQVDSAQGRWAAAAATTSGVVDRLRAAGVAPPVLAIALSHLAEMTSHVSPAKAMPIYDETLRLYTLQAERSPAADVDELREFALVALAAKQPKPALAWFERMPKAAEQLHDLRDQLQRVK